MAKNTSILLGEHFEEYITKKVSSGKYSSASEVIRTGLRMMEEEENKIIALREAIEAGERSGMMEHFDRDDLLKMLQKKHNVKN